MNVKAISLHQPWAAWVSLGWKTIETRTHNRFKSLEGERIAIHAAKKIDAQALFSLPRYKILNALEIQNFFMWMKIGRGKILCTATVERAGWVTSFDPCPDEMDEQAMCSTTGKYLLYLKDIKQLKNLLLVRGRQGIFNVPDIEED